MTTPYGTYPTNYPQTNPPPYNPNPPPANPYYQQQPGQPYFDPNVDVDANQRSGNNQRGYDNAAGPPPSYPPAAAAAAGMRAYTPEGLMDDDADSNMDSFSDKAVRRAFIRKVYLIVTCQLLFTLLFVILFSSLDPIKKFLRTYSWVYYIAYAIFFVTYIVLVCVKTARRKVPWNFVCLSVFTAAFTYMVATISGFYETYIVVIALAITVVVCV
ncbi:hypothetical protein HELRODRAFT_192009, partial [Helobdella robusta]|uniref:Uncharacterized protein n=1 Tax=Helobdella robusta TaxID=6412 RepID=T1FTI2_HELRO